MLISDKYKCILIKIPKNGSTSMQEALMALDPKCQVTGLSEPPYGHETASQARKIAGEERWNSYFKFAFIREPKSRFLSLYSYNTGATFTRQECLHWVLEKDYRLPDPYSKVIDKDMFARFHVYDKYWCFPYLKYQQVDWLDEDIWVGDLKNIEEDWKYVCSKIGVNVPLPKSNASDSDWWALDKEAEALLNMYYKEDFEFYEKFLNKKTKRRHEYEVA